jgi:hypothetical protein
VYAAPSRKWTRERRGKSHRKLGGKPWNTHAGAASL